MKLRFLAYCAMQLFLQTTRAEPKDKAWIEVHSSHFRTSHSQQPPLPCPSVAGLCRSKDDIRPAKEAVLPPLASRWIAGDHNEAVELWNSIAPEQRPRVIRRCLKFPLLRKLLQAQSNQRNAVIRQSWLISRSFVRDKRSPFAGRALSTPVFPTPFWYGGDQFSIWRHLEGRRAIIHYVPTTDTGYAGDMIDIEIRDDVDGPWSFAGS